MMCLLPEENQVFWVAPDLLWKMLYCLKDFTKDLLLNLNYRKKFFTRVLYVILKEKILDFV